MSTGVIIIFPDSHTHNTCHPDIDSQGLPYASPSLPRSLHSLRSHRPAKAEKVECAGFVNVGKAGWKKLAPLKLWKF